MVDAIDRKHIGTHLSKGITSFTTIRFQLVRVVRNQPGERRRGWFGVLHIKCSFRRPVAVGRSVALPVGMFVDGIVSPVVEFVWLPISPGWRDSGLLRLPGPVVQLIWLCTPTPCERVVQPLVPLLPLSIKTVVQILHLLRLTTVLCSENVLAPHRYDLPGDIGLIWCHRAYVRTRRDKPATDHVPIVPGQGSAVDPQPSA